VGQVARVLAQLDPRLERILASPLARALETATIVAGAFDPAPAVEPTELLAPGFRRLALLKHLESFGGDARLLLVGHQPDVGSLISWLIAETPQAAIAMGTASLAVLTMRRPAVDGEPTLHALLTPALLQTLDAQR